MLEDWHLVAYKDGELRISQSSPLWSFCLFSFLLYVTLSCDWSNENNALKVKDLKNAKFSRL
jgi:hypothetical protein